MRRPPRVRVSGTVRRLRAGSPAGLPMLQAELGGGADRITVVWLGRTRIAGIEPGRALAVEGMLSQQRGRKIMSNPRYDLGESQRPA
jgi:primosomal replication protein N